MVNNVCAAGAPGERWGWPFAGRGSEGCGRSGRAQGSVRGQSGTKWTNREMSAAAHRAWHVDVLFLRRGKSSRNGAIRVGATP